MANDASTTNAVRVDALKGGVKTIDTRASTGLSASQVHFGFPFHPQPTCRNKLAGRPPVRCCGLWELKSGRVKMNLESFFQDWRQGEFFICWLWGCLWRSAAQVKASQ